MQRAGRGTRRARRFAFHCAPCHEGNIAVGGGVSGERAYEREVEEATRNGLPIPKRASMAEIYGVPREGVEVFDINRGE